MWGEEEIEDSTHVMIRFPVGETVALTVDSDKAELYAKLFLDAMYKFNPDKFVKQLTINI